jgi:hypothetical protein
MVKNWLLKGERNQRSKNMSRNITEQSKFRRNWKRGDVQRRIFQKGGMEGQVDWALAMAR